MSDYILETKGLTKKSKKESELRNVDMKVRRNAIYGLLEPNGAD